MNIFLYIWIIGGLLILLIGLINAGYHSDIQNPVNSILNAVLVGSIWPILILIAIVAVPLLLFFKFGKLLKKLLKKRR